MKTRILTLALSMVIAVGMIGCSEEPLTTTSPDPASEAPSLPPVESMQFDFGFFGNGTSPSNTATTLSTEETHAKFNWLNAAVRVAFINVAILTAFGPPTAAFTAAIHTQPVVEEDGTFLWTYTWNEAPGHDVVIHLRGRIEGVHVNWSLRVTDDQANPPLNEFLWFRGQSSFVEDAGYWVFNDVDDERQIEVARIDWDFVDEEDRELVFENIHRGHDDYGDQLTYAVDGSLISVQFYDASEELTADIRWDDVTGVGSLKVPDYNDGERACWDEDQEDIDCPDITS